MTTLLPAAKSRLASVAISFFLKPLTTVSRSRRGLRSAVVSTAATNGVLPRAPAALASALRQIGVVDLDPTCQLGLSLACAIAASLSQPFREAQSDLPSMANVRI